MNWGQPLTAEELSDLRRLHQVAKELLERTRLDERATLDPLVEGPADDDDTVIRARRIRGGAEPGTTVWYVGNPFAPWRGPSRV